MSILEETTRTYKGSGPRCATCGEPIFEGAYPCRCDEQHAWEAAPKPPLVTSWVSSRDYHGAYADEPLVVPGSPRYDGMSRREVLQLGYRQTQGREGWDR